MPLTLFGKEHEPAFALLRSEEKPVGKDPLIALNALDWSLPRNSINLKNPQTSRQQGVKP